MAGDTLESFAAQYKSTPQEIVCFGNQMRNINNEFGSYWILGTMVNIPCPSDNPANVTCPEWELMQGVGVLRGGVLRGGVEDVLVLRVGLYGYTHTYTSLPTHFSLHTPLYTPLSKHTHTHTHLYTHSQRQV